MRSFISGHTKTRTIASAPARPQGEDPQLQAFRPKALAMIVSQYNKILVPANFSPLK